MDAGVVGARLASSVVAPLVKRLFVREGPGAGLVDRPVRVSGLVSFKGEKRELSEKDMRKIARELTAHAVRAAGPQDSPVQDGEQYAVSEVLAVSLYALGELDMDDVQAVQLGPERLADRLTGVWHDSFALSVDGRRLHDAVLQAACLHILNFFTQRSTFVARTLVAQSRQLHDTVTKLDLLIERLPSRTAEDARFEEQYAQYIARKHSKLTIYGIDLNAAREWPLDTAYLSLEAVSSALPEEDLQHHGPRTTAQPVEQMLAGHRRVLLRGNAGSGKTTLVQWLAVTTARQGELTGRMAHLMGRVPFVLPLRTLTRGGAELPIPAGFLGAVSCPLTGSQPQGWADRVLAAGRGVLLVDGIDEVPEQDRERTRRWLCDLVGAFPDNLLLVTSRPSAVREDWLGGEDFSELALATMKRDDIAVFIDRWHEAAGAETELAAALLQAVRTKADLGRLATNPLMCGLICALHRERRGFLPRGRKALYDAALSMLLERRDRERDMHGSGSTELDEESQTELLQKLAYWLIRNGRSEMEQSDAVGLLERVLPSMPYVGEQGDADAVFRYLLERSGLLREPAAGAVDFIHRTFQDYLGAKDAVEQRDFDLLVRHAHLDQWEDVVRMAVAHARAGERARLLRALVARGDAEEQHRTRLHLLATACLEHATQLDPAVREEVEARAAALIPPRSIDEAKALAEVGPVVLELLPGPERVEADEALATVHVAAQVATDGALPILDSYREHAYSASRQQLGGHWDRFDTEEYGERVIRHLTGDVEANISIRSEAELDCLRRLGGCARVTIQGEFTPQQISEALNGDTLVALTLSHNSTLTDLSWLGAFPRLEQLDLRSCPEITDLAPLEHLDLRKLWLWDFTEQKGLPGLSRLTRLEWLTLRDNTDWPGFCCIPRSMELTHLAFPATVQDLSGISEFRQLTEVNLFRVVEPLTSDDWRALADLPELAMLVVEGAHLGSLPTGEATFSRLTELVLPHHGDPSVSFELEALAAHFPALERLHVSGPAAEADLLPVSRLPLLTSVFAARVRHLRNAEHLPEGVKLTLAPRPRHP